VRARARTERDLIDPTFSLHAALMCLFELSSNCFSILGKCRRIE